MTVPLWPHQEKAVAETLELIEGGAKRILVTSPTGGGKTRIMAELIRAYLERDCRVVLYTNRKMLLEQTAGVMEESGFNFGVRAAGHSPEHSQYLQVSSIQTENARVLRSRRWGLHQARLVLIDEAHLQKGRMAQEIVKRHVATGAAVVGFTATPLDLAGHYDHLVVAGTTSELRRCGALVPCLHYGPDEPDLRHVGRIKLGEDLTQSQNVKAMMVNGVFGRVLLWYRRLNPEGKPAILFAPGVKESLWFAEQFHKEGISSAHIDGAEVWLDGQLWQSEQHVREEVMEGSQDGSIKVICNRFVLREGIDAPWLAHGILACVFGSLQSYLQSGGRLLRSYPGLASVTVQDHGGSWWRHGSLNADRAWQLGMTAHVASAMRQDRLRDKAEAEPWRCPSCGMILRQPRCRCGWEARGGKKSRPVIQADGSLIELPGDIYRPRRISAAPDGPRLWERMYHRSRRAERTFRAAAALFAAENNWRWPDPAWPLMPVAFNDWYRKVSEVSRERLR